MGYYLLDMGHNMASLASLVEAELKKDGHHYVIYLTDMEGLMCVEELTEDQFLDHFKNTKNGKA